VKEKTIDKLYVINKPLYELLEKVKTNLKKNIIQLIFIVIFLIFYK